MLASDIDQGAISIAKKGTYLKRQILNVPQELVSRYFSTQDGGETYSVTQEVKEGSFQRLNLIGIVLPTIWTLSSAETWSFIFR